MANTNNPGDETQVGGPGPFSEEEVAAATAGPAGDPELEDLDAADIDNTETETPFEKLVAKSKRLTPKQARHVVESVLFVAPQALSVDQLFEATGIDRTKLTKALESLQGDRRDGISGVVLHEVAGGWQFRTAPESSDYVRRFLKVKPQRLTRAALETLAIVAYRQPVTRPEIEDIRGVDSGAVLKALLDRRLIKIVGKKEEVGRPILYGTSREFLEFFALKDLNSLPTLREFHELTEEHQEIVEKEAPPTARGTVESLSDPGFAQRLGETDEASEAALAELEQAIDQADTTAKTAAKVLEPKPDPVEDGALGAPVPAAADAAPVAAVEAAAPAETKPGGKKFGGRKGGGKKSGGEAMAAAADASPVETSASAAAEASSAASDGLTSQTTDEVASDADGSSAQAAASSNSSESDVSASVDDAASEEGASASASDVATADDPASDQAVEPEAASMRPPPSPDDEAPAEGQPPSGDVAEPVSPPDSQESTS